VGLQILCDLPGHVVGHARTEGLDHLVDDGRPGGRGQRGLHVLDYMRDINELREHPRFYNTLTTNCTTMTLAHAAANPGHIPYSWKVLFSGYAPEYVYERGRLDRSLPYEELKRRAHINAAAHAADQAPDFSRRIRAGLP